MQSEIKSENLTQFHRVIDAFPTIPAAAQYKVLPFDNRLPGRFNRVKADRPRLPQSATHRYMPDQSPVSDLKKGGTEA
jgi:hypothetical protein